MSKQNEKVSKAAMDNSQSIRDTLEKMRNELINGSKQKLPENEFKVFEKEINDVLRPDVIENEIKNKKFNSDTKMCFIVDKIVVLGLIGITPGNKQNNDLLEEHILVSFSVIDIPFLPLRLFRSFLKLFDSEKVNRIPIVVKEKGFEFEKHYAETNDGYFLEIHRIFKGDTKGKKVVFLQHGLMDSSATWIMGSADESLGFILAAQGYDVWLGNVRGNIYSTRHKVYGLNEDQFWDFTWQDMAAKDLPSMINYVLQATKNTELFYVGHSQGGLIGFVEFSRNQDLCKKIKHFFALAPAVQLGNMKGLMGVLGNPLGSLNLEEFWYSTLGRQGLTFSDVEIDTLKLLPSKDLFLNWSVGPSDGNKAYAERINFILQFYPAGTSVKNLLHFVQLVQNAPKIKAFNYGSLDEKSKEIQWIGTFLDEPPEYDVGTINMPLTVYYGENDSLVSSKDIQILQESVKNKTNAKFEIMKTFNHVDFVWSTSCENCGL